MNEFAPLRASGSAHPDFAWTAQMVRPTADAGVGHAASFLRKEFEVGTPSGREVLRISARGLYRAFINGVRVGDDLLTPGWTAYDKRLAFQTYPVGQLLKAGSNIIDIWLADGWYRSQMMWKQNPIYNTWGNEIAAIAELRDGGGANAAAGSLGRKDFLPVGLHVDHRPLAVPGLVERLVEPPDLRSAVVCPFTLRVGVVDEPDEVRSVV